MLRYDVLRVRTHRFIGINFEFATNGNSSQSTDRDCDTLSGLKVSKHPTPIIGTTPINMDYVVIPDGLSTVDAGLSVHASKYCGKSLRILGEVLGKSCPVVNSTTIF